MLQRLRYLRGPEPLEGYDALEEDDVPAALQGADVKTLDGVRDYERKLRRRSSCWKRSPGARREWRSTHEQAGEARDEERDVETMRKLEAGDAPTDLKDWPSDSAMYKTYGSEDDRALRGRPDREPRPVRPRPPRRRLDLDQGREGRQPRRLQGRAHPGRPAPTPNSPKVAARKREAGVERDEERDLETMRKLEAGDAPAELKDWPSDSAMYKTYGSRGRRALRRRRDREARPAGPRPPRRRLDLDQGQEGRQPRRLQGRPGPGRAHRLREPGLPAARWD